MTLHEHTHVSGQSLSVGNSGQPAISTVAENGAKEGLRDGSLVPLQRGQDPSADLPGNERPEFALGYRLAAARAGVVTITSTDGQGGQTIAALSKGGSTGEYEAGVSRIAAVRAAVTTAGHTHAVRALHWIQGEANQVDSTTIAEYIAAVEQLRADYAADLATPDLAFISSQTSTLSFSGSGTGVPRICLAQLALHRAHPWFTLAGPHYAFPRENDGGTLHLNGHGYYYLGELHARASLAKINGTGWNPLMPLSVEHDHVGHRLTITFAVPVAPMVLDTTSRAAQPHHGFSVHGVDVDVTDVSLTGPDTVVLQLSGPVVGNASVGYGVAPEMASYGGNLRDSETALSVHDGHALPNWSVLFLEPIPPAPPAKAYRLRSKLLVARADGGLVPLAI